MGRTGGDPTSLHAWEIYFSIMVEGWGLAIMIGSVPYAIIGYIVGYHWTLRVAIRWQNARLVKRDSAGQGPGPLQARVTLPVLYDG